MKYLRISIFLISIVLLGCSCDYSSKKDPLDGERRKLSENRSLWNQQNIEDYQFNFHQSCFCGPDITREKTIVVSGNTISEAFYIDTSEYLTEEELDRLMTIDERYEYIENKIDETPDQLEVIYNPEYGYPEEIHIDHYREAIDDEVSFYISELMESS
jgi:uncharacterized protein DUF6174